MPRPREQGSSDLLFLRALDRQAVELLRCELEVAEKWARTRLLDVQLPVDMCAATGRGVGTYNNCFSRPFVPPPNIFENANTLKFTFKFFL